MAVERERLGVAPDTLIWTMWRQRLGAAPRYSDLTTWKTQQQGTRRGDWMGIV